MLRVRLFGSGEATYENRPLLGFPSGQAYLLLCYLLLNARRVHLRDSLAAIFWGEHSNQVARKYLRNTLWKIRQSFAFIGICFDDYLLVTKDSIAFIRSSPYWSDVDAFESAIQQCQDIPGQRLSAEQGMQLEEAIDLYSGDLLEGVYQDWCLYERERLGLMYLIGLAKLMSFHEFHGNYEHSLSYGQRILERDSTRENVHVQMMRLHWLNGNPAAALTQYQRCKQILMEELDISPQKETTHIYQQMLHHQYYPALFTPTKKPVTSSALSENEDPNLQQLMERALYKLQSLQGMLDETRLELRHIEQLLYVDLLKSE